MAEENKTSAEEKAPEATPESTEHSKVQTAYYAASKADKKKKFKVDPTTKTIVRA